MKFLMLPVFLFSFSASSHTMLTFPSPRSTNSGIKTGPCGGLPRSAVPLTVQGGKPINVTWQETINHPGRFIFYLSMGNDQNFSQNKLATIMDTMNDGNTPHNYSTMLQMPNVNCDTCTLQLIQSMEENPNAPTYYYSCADIKIVATSAAGTSPPVTSTEQTSNVQKEAPSMKSCGLVKSIAPRSKFDFTIFLFIFMLPILTALYFSKRKLKDLRNIS